jgi:predicted alpha/beta superfamily hydrolase
MSVMYRDEMEQCMKEQSERIAELERDIENLKAVFRVNMLRAHPSMSHDEITTAIEDAIGRVD